MSAQPASLTVYVEPSGRRIAPFDDPIGETLVANRPLSAWQAEAFAAAGLQVAARLAPPCLVVPDTLLCTGDALRRFVAGAAGRDAVLVLARSEFGRSTTPVQPEVSEVEAGWRFERIRWVSGRGEAPVEVVVDPQERVHELRSLPYDMSGDTMKISIARDPLMTLHHWVHILWANQVIGGVALMRTPKWRWIARGLWAAARARSLNKWKVLGKLNQIGKGCDIHPTAVVEGSTLGDGVSVGPFARVLFSTLGDKAIVMPQAQLDLCTIGAKATISEATVVRFSVVYPEAVVSQHLMQQCVIGRRAVTTGGAYSIDLNFEQDIRVPLDGQLWSTGQRFLGSAFGHRARIGTGFWLASGRMVPNDYFLVRDPQAVLAKIPEDLPGKVPLNASGRILRPL